MSAPLFRHDDTAGLRPGSRVVLGGDEGRHAATVRRLAAGERVDLTDGRGALAVCGVVAAGRADLTLVVERREDVPPPQPRVVVVQALVKGDRGELAVELMTEVGVDAVVPWTAARSVAQWKAERGEKALARWRSTAREAAKQARRAWAPEVHDLATTRDVVALLRDAALAVVLHEEAVMPLVGLDLPPEGDVVLVVGPEGGLTGDEVDAFEDAGGLVSRLGPTVLRTSTAGAAAAAVVLARGGRWS